MLLELKVNNFAIIENLHIQFSTGLNILSGETGAGKSVLLKSLGLLMGQKGSTESIRTNCTSASIEGSFDISKRKDIQKKLTELGIDFEDHLLIVKRVLQDEKSRVYLNGSLSTLNTLREIVAPLIEVAGSASPLIEMTGQHDNRNLLSKSYHLDLLDYYSGTWEFRSQFEDQFKQWQDNNKKIIEFETHQGQNQQRLDFLVFQKNEISKLDLQPGEELKIEHELKLEKSTTQITQFVDQAEELLVNEEGSALEKINHIAKRAHELSGLDPSINELYKSLSQSKTLLEDSVYDLRKTFSNLDFNPQKRDALEKRLSDIRKLQKKYGPTVDDILIALTKIEAEIHQIENYDSTIEKLKKEQIKIKKELSDKAAEMHKRRLGASKTLTDSVNRELLDLNMKGVTFQVSCKEQDLCATGNSDVEFMSRTSNQDSAKPLAKFASGGELSRILLSLKRVVGFGQHPRTYLFDEVDTGVSGPTAEKVGKKLKSIAQGQQVICVTHLPQVAAAGDVHFYIQKSPMKTGVTMDVKSLKQKDRIEEIARLISGEKITKTSMDHAAELLQQAKG
jgi:DNA repair protein RecN (Recombination protein N)